MMINYRQQRSWGKFMFLHVSVILFTGGLSQCMLGYHPLRAGRYPLPPGPGRHPHWEQTPSPRDQAGTPWEQTPRPQGPGTPLHSAYWEIRPTSRRYASYWNAFLFYNRNENAFHTKAYPPRNI